MTPRAIERLRRDGFTLIELVAVLALAAALTAAASLTLAGTGRRAQFRGACEQVAATDFMARDLARRQGRPVTLGFDLAAGRITRDGDGAGGSEGAVLVAQLPPGVRIELVQIAGRGREGAGRVTLDYSARGYARTYAVLLTGPGGHRAWLACAGLTGQFTTFDDAEVDQIFAADDNAAAAATTASRPDAG